MSQWFFSMRNPSPERREIRRIYGYGKLKSDESKALSEALNPFARENESERIIAGLIQRDFDAFMDDRPSIVGDVIGGRNKPAPRCSTCDECVFRATGVYPKSSAKFGDMSIRTNCRMPNNLIELVYPGDFAR